MTDTIQDRLRGPLIAQEGESIHAHRLSMERMHEAAEALTKQAEEIEDLKKRQAQDSQWLISYQKLLEDAGMPPSSTDIIEAWKAAKVKEIERLEAKIDSFGMKHPADPDFYKQYTSVRWSDHHVTGQYLEVQTVDGWQQVYPLIEKILEGE